MTPQMKDKLSHVFEKNFDFLHLKRSTGEATANKIVEVLTENNIPADKMRGQAYDGAAAMSSEKTVKPLASKLQKRDLNVHEARTLITDRIERVKEMRGVDVEFETWYEDCKRIANQLEIEEKFPRTCHRQTQRTNIGSSCPQQYYKATVAVPFLDHLSTELNDRFHKDDRVAYAFSYLVPKQMFTLSDSEIQKLSSEFFFWDSDLRCSSSQDLQGHLFEWKSSCGKLDEKGITADNLLDTYKIADGDIFPDIKTLLHIGCTLPVTSCEAERSFSGLRHIKSYMRSTMNEDRLSSLALMHLHHARTINAGAICQRFVMQNKRRMFKSSILYN
ncbi:52 kDa repressor of the inhibitor of the protein kinase-like [Ylistrum balloti]|uniref:52 kDa repressor of the inhibitor of the protein kinase-like n=1 Tax=Ylistrum balloti TaxID=509963 RepID=UPI002905B133|nr:52 kDa repressor of the inhibitor of the protein kinase-like [Ylistrum balloti]